MRSKPHPHRHQSGFSLLEMVLSLILIGILSVISLNMISNSYSTTRSLNNENAATSTARYAIERVSREIRKVAYDANTKLIQISNATPTQLSFTKSEPASTSLVTIRISGQSLLLSDPAPGTESVLANDVTAFSLQYFDASMGGSPSLSQIRFVQINLTIQTPGANAVSLSSLVALRNG